MTGLEMFIHFYAFVAKWVFSEIDSGNTAEVELLLKYLPGFHWNTQNETLVIYDVELEKPDIDYPEDIDEWESYFSHAVHDPQYASHILPAATMTEDIIIRYRHCVMRKMRRYGLEIYPVLSTLAEVLDCLDTSYMH